MGFCLPALDRSPWRVWRGDVAASGQAGHIRRGFCYMGSHITKYCSLQKIIANNQNSFSSRTTCYERQIQKFIDFEGWTGPDYHLYWITSYNQPYFYDVTLAIRPTAHFCEKRKSTHTNKQTKKHNDKNVFSRNKPILKTDNRYPTSLHYSPLHHPLLTKCFICGLIVFQLAILASLHI